MYISSLLWITSLIAGYFLGTKKNRLTLSLLLCVFFGPLGLVVTCFIPSKPKKLEP